MITITSRYTSNLAARHIRFPTFPAFSRLLKGSFFLLFLPRTIKISRKKFGSYFPGLDERYGAWLKLWAGTNRWNPFIITTCTTIRFRCPFLCRSIRRRRRRLRKSRSSSRDCTGIFIVIIYGLRTLRTLGLFSSAAEIDCNDCMGIKYYESRYALDWTGFPSCSCKVNWI